MPSSERTSPTYEGKRGKSRLGMSVRRLALQDVAAAWLSRRHVWITARVLPPPTGNSSQAAPHRQPRGFCLRRRCIAYGRLGDCHNLTSGHRRRYRGTRRARELAPTVWRGRRRHWPGEPQRVAAGFPGGFHRPHLRTRRFRARLHQRRAASCFLSRKDQRQEAGSANWRAVTDLKSPRRTGDSISLYPPAYCIVESREDADRAWSSSATVFLAFRL